MPMICIYVYNFVIMWTKKTATASAPPRTPWVLEVAFTAVKSSVTGWRWTRFFSLLESVVCHSRCQSRTAVCAYERNRCLLPESLVWVFASMAFITWTALRVAPLRLSPQLRKVTRSPVFILWPLARLGQCVTQPRGLFLSTFLLQAFCVNKTPAEMPSEPSLRMREQCFDRDNAGGIPGRQSVTERHFSSSRWPPTQVIFLLDFRDSPYSKAHNNPEHQLNNSVNSHSSPVYLHAIRRVLNNHTHRK